jgi:hypothetical protein
MCAAFIVVPAILYPLAGTWTWLWAPLSLMVLALALLLSAVTGGQPPLPTTTVRDEPRSARVRDTRMASLTEDYEFVFSADVRWRWTEGPDARLRNPARAAENAIVTAARVEATKYRAVEVDVAHHALAARLGEAVPVHGGILEVWADDVVLSLPEEDADRLRQLADLRKENNRWEVERSVERIKRAYFADDVFATPGNAVIWDLVRNGADVETTVKRVGSLAQLSEAGKGKDLVDLRERLREWEPEPTPAAEGMEAEDGGGFGTFHASAAPGWHAENSANDHGETPADRAEALAEVIASVEDDDQRTMFADRLVRVLEHSPLAHLAPRLRERFDLPGATSSEADANSFEDDGTPDEGETDPGV